MAESEPELQRARWPIPIVARMLVPFIGWWGMLAIGLLVFIGGVLPNALSLSVGWLVARIETTAGDAGALVGPLVVIGVIFVAANAHGPFLNAIGRALGSRFDTELRDRALVASASPGGIAHLEDPRVADRLVHLEDLVHGWLTSRSVLGMITSSTGYLRGTIAAGILMSYRWWAPIPVFIAYRLVHQNSIGRGFLFLRRYMTNTQELRRAAYLRELVHSGIAAKEARVFGLSTWFIDGFRAWWDEGMADVWRARVRNEITLIPVALGLGVSLGWLAGSIGLSGARGELSVATAVVLIQSAFGMAGFQSSGDAGWQMYFGAHRAREASRMAETLKTPDSDLRGDASPVGFGRIRFEDVRFSYPGQDEVVLDGLDLEIPAGTSLAIVGENGAGKTTTTKLLARLYDPTQGRILIDDIDLQTCDPDAWRRNVGVIFQDFVRYELSTRENIGYGALHRIDDEEALRRAAVLAGADVFLDRVGWDRPLSRRYADGIDLSGGEWQRVALARALFAIEGGAKLLILDEPTANLDVRAEAAIYERFLEMTHGVTTILISHRFSTVRMADRIVVIEGGRVVEQGTHDELVAERGRYARMFEAQASAYRDGPLDLDALDDALLSEGAPDA